MSNKLSVGGKLYSYCYGPLTIVEITQNLVVTKADDTAGMAEDILKLYIANEKTVKFAIDTIGHWVFERATDVGKENNNVPEIWLHYGTLRKNPEYYHSYYRNKPAVEMVSSVGSSDDTAVSSVGSYDIIVDGSISSVGSID